MKISAKLKECTVIAAVSAAAMAAFFLFMPKLGLKPVEVAPPKESAVVFDFLDSGNGEMGELNDFAPMFIPTRWNNSGGKFLGDISLRNIAEPEIYPVYGIDVEIKPDINPVPFSDTDKLLIFMRGAFASFGRDNPVATSSAPRSALVVVRDLSTGREVFRKGISVESGVPMLEISEFLLRNDNGFVQAPFLQKSSGNEAVDLQNRALLREKISPQLPSGDFKATIIP